ncbi:MAG TPA: ATP synthase subunit I [Kofleriaceae bacterium]|nr:ATP synthase subunit I [Kofleriaceae bacterium]
MDRSMLTRIERLNYIVGGGVVALTAAFGSAPHVLGALVGVILCAVNFSAVRRLVERMMRSAQGAPQSRASAFLLAPKLLLLMGGAAAAIIFLPISAIMLAVGFSVFLVSIGVEMVRYVLRNPEAGPRGPHGDDPTESGPAERQRH